MITIREIERIVPLKIGFIGYNSRLTQDGLMKFSENNKEDVEIFNYKQSYIRMKEGTEIFGLFENRPNKGHMLDQLILFDDDRWLIKSEKYNFIHLIMQYFICQYSCVPEEFQILEYEDLI